MTSLHESGYEDENIEIGWEADFSFVGQIFELTVPVPRDGPLDG